MKMASAKLLDLILDSSSSIASSYFYLKPNDVLYVEPTADEVAGTSNYRTRDIAVISSALSLMIIVSKANSINER